MTSLRTSAWVSVELLAGGEISRYKRPDHRYLTKLGGWKSKTEKPEKIRACLGVKPINP